MYNLAKLLTEEPAKLEKIWILFLKLAVTIFIANEILWFNLSFERFINIQIPDSFSLSTFVVVIVSLAFIWYVIWVFAAELILELVSLLLSLLRFKESTIAVILVILNVVKQKNRMVEPAKNILIFNEFLNSFSTRYNNIIEENSRMKKYFVLFIAILLVFFFSDDVVVPNWFIWTTGGLFTFLVIFSLILNQFLYFFYQNIDGMKKQYSRLAFTQLAINSLLEDVFVQNHFELENNCGVVELKKKTKEHCIPNEIKILPFHVWNESLGERMFRDAFKEMRKKTQSEEKEYLVFISNYKPSQEDNILIKSIPNLVYLYCEDDIQISNNLEVMFYKLTNSYYYQKDRFIAKDI